MQYIFIYCLTSNSYYISSMTRRLKMFMRYLRTKSYTRNRAGHRHGLNTLLCCDDNLPSSYFLPDSIWAVTPVCLLLCIGLSLLRAWRHSYLQLLRLKFRFLVTSQVDFAYMKLQVIKINVVEPRIYLKCLITLRNIWSAHLKLELKNKPRCTRQPKTKRIKERVEMRMPEDLIQ